MPWSLGGRGVRLFLCDPLPVRDTVSLRWRMRMYRMHIRLLLLLAFALVAGSSVACNVSNETERHVVSPREREIRRVQGHLDRALSLLAHAETSDLSTSQRRARQLHMAELRRYRDAGEFPKNRDYPQGLRPTFVDDEGTHCALAHLIAATGESELVARIAGSQNHAYVRELAMDTELASWLRKNGLSVAEAARIQPGYSVTPSECFCSRYIHKVVADAKRDERGNLVIEALYGDPEAAPSGVGSTIKRPEEDPPQHSRSLLIASGGRWWPSVPYDGDKADCESCGRMVSYCSKDGPLPKGYVIDALLADDCYIFFETTPHDGYAQIHFPIANPPTHAAVSPTDESSFWAVFAATIVALLSVLGLAVRRLRRGRQHAARRHRD